MPDSNLQSPGPLHLLTSAIILALALACSDTDQASAPPDATVAPDTARSDAPTEAPTKAPTKPDCSPRGPARPICGFTNPEDMVPLPGNEAILIGEYGQSAEDHAGELVVFDLASESRTVAFRGGDTNGTNEPGWGDPTCTTPPDARFNSHGIDLVRREDGRLALLVVEHGSREAVEFFEVTGGGAEWQLAWRGCVESPPDASLNEVVGLPDGRFFTTKMTSLAGAAEISDGFPTSPTGRAFLWSPEGGFEGVGGSEGILPNGIAASPDGRFLYMNASGENSIRKIDVAAGREIGRAEVMAPDNVTWSPDGRLLVASLRAFDPDLFAECAQIVGKPCPMPFAIEAVDPESMTPLGPVYESDGQPMGAGTVGLQVGNELFVGSFKGDRILRIALGSDGRAR